ncbi:MAG: polyphosphate:AMP phosphotransferase [Eubacteriales bacterium]|nr:polyphosphate:AMP phosphotransferase [Eubacteriales bacterium]
MSETDQKTEWNETDEQAPLNAPMEEQEYDFGQAEEKLLALQQEIRQQKIPVVIVLEGWSAAGKGTMAGELLEGLDARGYNVCVNEHFGKEEVGYPDFHRYWTRMPAKGEITLFIGSWYDKLCSDLVKGKGKRELERIKLMENMLACDGVVILKFFIDISQKEQKRRLKEMEEKKRTCTLVSKEDWRQNKEYDQWEKVYIHARQETDAPGREWHLLPGNDKRACKKALYETVTAAFEEALAKSKAGDRSWDVPQLSDHEPLETERMQHLQMFDPAQALEEDYKSALNAAQKRLKKLQYEVYREGIPVVIAFEGWDAAGKGGAIRRLTNALDVRGYEVEPIAAPTAEEKAHHHLWRFWTKLPKQGEIRIFDRTWYGRVMVERIEGFCTEPQWQRAYEEMNLFEKELHDAGTVICKFWLQIDNEEQLRRFEARQNTPDKQWKITDEDWRNREKWPQYEAAVDEMLQKTHTAFAPWTVVEADNKQYARIKVLTTVADAMEKALEHKKK